MFEDLWIRRAVAFTMCAVIFSVVAALLIGLFDPKVDNDKIFPIIAGMCQTILGYFAGAFSRTPPEPKNEKSPPKDP